MSPEEENGPAPEDTVFAFELHTMTPEKLWNQLGTMTELQRYISLGTFISLIGSLRRLTPTDDSIGVAIRVVSRRTDRHKEADKQTTRPALSTETAGATRRGAGSARSQTFALSTRTRPS